MPEPATPSRPPLGSIHRPLNVVAMGSSVTFMVNPPRSSRDDGTYSELLVDLLAEHGVHARTQLHSRWFSTLPELMSGFEHGVRDRCPDVVIINVGFVDCQPRVMPTGVLRHFTTWRVGIGPISSRYRAHVAPQLWRPLRRYQRLASARVGIRAGRVPPRKFARELGRLIWILRHELQALVLVMDIDPTSDRLRFWLPSIDRQIGAYNNLLAQAVTAVDHPDVVLVRTSTDIEALGVDETLPDGIHRTAQAHRLAAEALAPHVLEWLARQPQHSLTSPVDQA